MNRRSFTHSMTSNSSSIYPIVEVPPVRAAPQSDEYLNIASTTNVQRRPTYILKAIMSDDRGRRGPLGLHVDQDEDFSRDDLEESDDSFVNFAFLSNLAVQLRDKVPRGTHVKGGVPHPHAFTGKDIVV